MNACISVGRLSEARQLLEDMKEQKVALDSRAYNILLKGLSRKGDMAGIPAVLQEMQQANIKPSSVTYNTLINSYVEDGQLDQARRVCAEAQTAGVLHAAAMKVNASCTAFSQSACMCVVALQCSRCTAGVELDVFSYSALIKGFVQRNQLQAALDVLATMSANQVKPNEVWLF